MAKRKTVLITGATGGIGYEVAKRLVQEGHNVYAVGRSADKLTRLKMLGAHVISADLSMAADTERLLATAPVPDTVIFSAGVGYFREAKETTDSDVRQMFEINVFSPMAITRYYLSVRPGIHLIYVGSLAGRVATPKASAYAASKHALLGYIQAVRLETEGKAIISAVNTGPVDTGFLDIADSSGKYRHSLGKFLLQPDKVADKIIRVMEKPVREVTLPRYMGAAAKFHALWPALAEKAGRSFFHKK